MADEQRRADERRAAQGDVQAAAHALRERIRAREVDPARLQLAAYLGDATAATALGSDAPEVPDDLCDWVEGLATYGPILPVQAALAAARPALDAWEAGFVDERDVIQPQEIVEAVETWIDCPCREHALILHAAPQVHGARPRDVPPLTDEALEALERAWAAGDREAGIQVEVERFRRGTERFVDPALAYDRQFRQKVLAELEAAMCLPLEEIARGMNGWKVPNPHNMGLSVRDAGRTLGPERVREAIRDELVPWVLDETALRPWHFPAVSVRLVQDDLSRRCADVIANAANDQLLMQGGVAAALRAAGGDEIEREAAEHAPAPLGSVVRTGAGRLAAQEVFHAVVIRYSLVGGTSAPDVHVAVRESVVLAQGSQRSTLALPLFGAGVGGLSVAQSLETILDALESVADPGGCSRLQVEVVVLDGEEYELAERAWRAFQPKAVRDAEAENSAEEYLRLLESGRAGLADRNAGDSADAVE